MADIEFELAQEDNVFDEEKAEDELMIDVWHDRSLVVSCCIDQPKKDNPIFLLFWLLYTWRRYNEET